MRQVAGMIGWALCWSVAQAAEPETPDAEAPPSELREVHHSEIGVKLRTYPKYPPEARAQNVEGDCDVRLTVDERGKTTSAEALNCPPLFVEASTTAAMGSSFYPVKEGGVPVKVSVVLHYKYRLGAPSGGPNTVGTAAAAPPAPPKGRFRELEFTELTCGSLAPVTFPDQARAAGVESACRVMLYLNAQGEVIHTEPVDCGEPFLSAAREAAQPLVCEPVERRGEAIPVKAEYTFNFRLQ